MRSVHLRMPRFLALLAAIVLCSANAISQTNYGGVRGEVKDAQGASIPGAHVTLTNEGTKVSRSVVTNATGIYLFGGVDPGVYKVAITMPGFKAFTTTGNIVTLGNTVTVDAAMQIGSATESVDVSAETLTLNTASASGGQLFSEQQVQTLPTLGRNPFMFATLDANVVTLGDPRYVRAEDSTGSSEVSLAGAPSGTNSYAVDGIPISSSSGGETYIVSPDATAEAKVQADTFDAEIGRTGGGVFAVSQKVGTSRYHGELYGETRQTPWSANVWFNPNHSPTPSDTTYLYSGAFGGPLVPPDLKDKAPHWLDNTFYWLTEEGYRQGQPNTGTNSYYVPTAAERTGNYSADSVLLYDPTQQVASNGTHSCRLSFLGDCGGIGGAGSPSDPLNVVPTSYINPIGNYVLNAIPQPTNANTYASTTPNYINPVQSFKSRSDEYVGKVEHTFSPWWTASASYLHDAVQEPDILFLVTNLCNCTKLIRYFDSTIVNNTFPLNATTLLTVGYGFNRYYSSSPQYSTGFNTSNGFGGAGFPASYTNYEASKTFPAFSFQDVSNFTSASTTSIVGGSSGGPTIQASNNWVINMTKTIDKHTLKFGYVYRAFNYYTDPTTGSAGLFNFDGQYSAANGGSNSSNGPAAFADLQMGLPDAATTQINAGPFINMEKYNSLYAQDDFRLSQKITFNVGVRYEYELGQYEKNNKYNVAFNPNAISSYTNYLGNTVNVIGGIQFAGVNGAPFHCCDYNRNKVSPRIGVAYQIEKNTVLHAGFGVFYAPVGITPETSGYSQVTSYAPGNATGTASVGTSAYLSNPFSSGILQPTGNTLGPLTGVGGSITLPASNRQYPYVEQYLVDVQHQFPGDVIVKLSYIGAHGNNFPNTVNINQIPDAVLASYAPGGTNYGTNLATGPGNVKPANPYAATTIGGIPATGVVSHTNTTIAQGQLLLPYPQFTSVNLVESDGYSNYNSMAVKVEKRMARSLTVLGTYTWSSNWDNLYGTGSQVFSTYGPQNNHNIQAEYARSINSIPNRLTAAITYELPFGRGRMFLNQPSGFMGHILDAVAGGWELNYEVVDQNGVPLSVTQTDESTNYGTTGIGGSYQRPNLVGDPHAACEGGSPQTRLGFGARPYVNPAAFTAAAPYTYGNTSRSLPCRAPGSDTTTASVNKSFSITERVKFQFRAEFLNLYNTPQFGYPTTTLAVNQPVTAPATATVTTPVAVVPLSSSTQTFGNLNAQIGFGRVIQLGGRITF